MIKLSATSSQRKPRDEIGRENISNEAIWAEIYHDKNGKTVLKNIPRQRNVQNLDLEDTFFEVSVMLIKQVNCSALGSTQTQQKNMSVTFTGYILARLILWNGLATNFTALNNPKMDTLFLIFIG